MNPGNQQEPTATVTDSHTTETVDRRRQGRPPFVNPRLIPLLRRTNLLEASALKQQSADWLQAADAAEKAGAEAARAERSQAGLAGSDTDLDDEAGNPPRGIMIGLLIVTPFWCAVAAAGWLLFR